MEQQCLTEQKVQEKAMLCREQQNQIVGSMQTAIAAEQLNRKKACGESQPACAIKMQIREKYIITTHYPKLRTSFLMQKNVHKVAWQLDACLIVNMETGLCSTDDANVQ